MTPDKVEAALGVLESARRTLCSQDLREVLMNVQNNINSPACAGMANAALVRMDRLPDLREALATITSALAERGWRPIESAPRDGSCVLLADSDSVTPGFYHDGSECYGHRGGAGFFDESDRGSLLTASNFHATHWQPLPEPPHAR